MKHHRLGEGERRRKPPARRPRGAARRGGAGGGEGRASPRDTPTPDLEPASPLSRVMPLVKATGTASQRQLHQASPLRGQENSIAARQRSASGSPKYIPQTVHRRELSYGLDDEDEEDGLVLVQAGEIFAGNRNPMASAGVRPHAGGEGVVQEDDFDSDEDDGKWDVDLPAPPMSPVVSTPPVGGFAAAGLGLFPSATAARQVSTYTPSSSSSSSSSASSAQSGMLSAGVSPAAMGTPVSRASRPQAVPSQASEKAFQALRARGGGIEVPSPSLPSPKLPFMLRAQANLRDPANLREPVSPDSAQVRKRGASAAKARRPPPKQLGSRKKSPTASSFLRWGRSRKSSGSSGDDLVPPALQREAMQQSGLPTGLVAPTSLAGGLGSSRTRAGSSDPPSSTSDTSTSSGPHLLKGFFRKKSPSPGRGRVTVSSPKHGRPSVATGGSPKQLHLLSPTQAPPQLQPRPAGRGGPRRAKGFFFNSGDMLRRSPSPAVAGQQEEQERRRQQQQQQQQQQQKEEAAPATAPAGGAQLLPHATSADALPVRLTGDILWAWFEGEGAAGEALPFQAFPEDRFPRLLSAEASYVRELPYSFDFLVENFMDPAHIPFAHHSLQSLRSDGSEIPMETLVSNDTHLEVSFQDQVRGKARTGVVSFARPCFYHFRTVDSGGASKVGLFMLTVPVEHGRSRLFILGRKREELPPLFRIFPTWLLHLVSNRFVDTDIWLHEAEVAATNGLSPGASLGPAQSVSSISGDRPLPYVLPTSSDHAVIEWRRWWKTSGMARARPNSFGPAPPGSLAYLPREQQLDRFQYHVKSCSTCRTTLRRARRCRDLAFPLALAAAIAPIQFSAKAAAVAVALFVRVAASRVASALGDTNPIDLPLRSVAASAK